MSTVTVIDDNPLTAITVCDDCGAAWGTGTCNATEHHFPSCRPTPEHYFDDLDDPEVICSRR